MSTALRMLARLLFHRPLVVALLALVYLVGAFLLLVLEAKKSGMAVAMFAGVGAAGSAAILTERIAKYSCEAGRLGLPNHARIMRRVQAWFLALFVAVPIVVAVALAAAPLAAAAALMAAAAVGIVLGTYGGVWLFGLLLLAKFTPLVDWIALAPMHGLIIAFSAALIWRWFALPLQQEGIGAIQPMLLSDALHEVAPLGTEQDATAIADTCSARPDPIDAFVVAEIARVRSWRTIPASLALGLGYSERTAWKSVARAVAAALAILFVWHHMHGSKPAALAYWCMTGICCFALVGRLQALLQAWMQTSVEQGLLRLAPGWPAARAIKCGVVLSTLFIQAGSIASWAAITISAMLPGWIKASDALIAGTAMYAVSLGFTGSAWALLSHRRVREWHFSTIALVLLVGAGAVTSLLGQANSCQLLLGWALMLAPPIAALTWYWIAPLRFPLDVDPRALKAAQ